MKWFKINSLASNPGIFQFKVLRKKKKKNGCQRTLKINSKFVYSSDDVIVLGITIDKNLTFMRYINNLCRDAQCKLQALQQIRNFLTVEKDKLLGKSFIAS